MKEHLTAAAMSAERAFDTGNAGHFAPCFIDNALLHLEKAGIPFHNKINFSSLNFQKLILKNFYTDKILLRIKYLIKPAKNTRDPNFR